RFEDLGLINDAEFARMWIDSRQRTKGLARRALAAELHRKGIDDDTAGDALDAIDPDVERQAAHRLVQKRLRSMQKLSSQVQKRRLVAMLARKGYAAGMAHDVVDSEQQSLHG